MFVVLDTNVLVSAHLSPEGFPAKVMDCWRKGAFDLLVSPPILKEYKKALAYGQVQKYHGLSDEEIAREIEDVQALSYPVSPEITVDVIKTDPKDNMFLECALWGGADYIISGDAHLLELKEYEGILILSPKEFLAFLGLTNMG